MVAQHSLAMSSRRLPDAPTSSRRASSHDHASFRIEPRPLHWQWIAGSLVLAILLSYGLILATRSRYIVVDDPLLTIIADGGYGNANIPYLMFINIILGWVLQGLHAVAPAIVWYPIIMTGIECVAFWYALMLVRRCTAHAWPIAVLVLLQCFASLSFTYTTVAAVAATAGLGGLSANALMRARWTRYIAPALLLWCGYLVRVPSFVIAVLIGLALLLFAWLNTDRGGKTALAVALVATMLAAGLSGLVNTNAYAANVHNENALIRQDDAHRMVDYTPVSYEQNQDAFKAMGWSQNDLDAYYQWVIADFDVYSVSNLGTLGSMNTFSNKYQLSPIKLAKAMANSACLRALAAVTFLTVLAIALSRTNFTGRERQGLLALCIGTALLTVAAVLMLYVRQRAVVNALMAVVLSGGLTLAFVVNCAVCRSPAPAVPGRDSARIAGNGRVGITISIIATLLACASLGLMAHANGALRSNSAASSRDAALTSWMDQHPNTLVATGSNMHYMQTKPIFEIRTPRHFLHMVKIGSWSIDGQRWYDQLEQWNVDPDHLILDMARKTDIVFIPDDEHELNTVVTFIEEHTGNSVTAQPVEQLDQSTVIYQLSMADK